MTKNASFKKVVRRHVEETGQRYTEALMDLEGLGARMDHEPVTDRRQPFAGCPARPRGILGRMGASAGRGPAPARLRCGAVLRVQEDACEIFGQGQSCVVRYARSFPSPRTERVFPGHLVAVAAVPDGSEVVAWRWYDAVVLGEDAGLVRLWEPSHGEVVARPRRAQRRPPGTRAYLSAGLPGADWWVAGAVAATADEADVELGEVERFYDDRGLWRDLI